MSKKHFIALADTLTEIRRRLEFSSDDTTGTPGDSRTIETPRAIAIVEDELVRFCRSQNGRFMPDRFLDYSRGECGPNGGALKKHA